MLLGIDIGGSKIAYALGDDSGRILGRRRRPTDPSGDPGRDLDRIAADARALVAEEGEGALETVGVSVPGPLDARLGLVIRPPNLPNWDAVPVARMLEERLGCPVALENDANAAALAEHRFGAGRGCQDLVYLTMSTGVGGGIILGGQLHRGRIGSAGELGHTPVEWPGQPCACGLEGCLEAYLGGAALARRMREHAPESSACLALAGGREALSAEHLVEAARSGDAWAGDEMNRFNGYLAQAVVSLAFSLAPEKIVLGTIAVAAGESLCFGPVRALVAERLWPHQAPYLEIVPAELGEDLPYQAALCVALQAGKAG
ncbi:MAG: ROK family protein [Myxococcota bacterium]|nr:ROK family protein [Myxococcota bacterium]